MIEPQIRMIALQWTAEILAHSCMHIGANNVGSTIEAIQCSLPTPSADFFQSEAMPWSFANKGNDTKTQRQHPRAPPDKSVSGAWPLHRTRPQSHRLLQFSTKAALPDPSCLFVISIGLLPASCIQKPLFCHYLFD